MEERPQRGETQCEQGDGLRDPLPDRDQRADHRIVRQAVETWPVRMLQHVHDMRPAHAGRVVQAGVVVAAFLQIRDTVFRMVDHVFLGAEHQRPGRTRLDARRLHADRDTVGTQGAFINRGIFLRDPRDVERTTCDAITAADTVLFVEIDDAVRILDDGARRGAGGKAARIGAVQATVLADQPFEAIVRLLLVEAHHGPRFVTEVARAVELPVVRADLVAQVVPFHARGFTGFTPDTFGDVDQLGDRGRLADRRTLGRGRRASFDVERLQRHVRLRLFPR